MYNDGATFCTSRIHSLLGMSIALHVLTYPLGRALRETTAVIILLCLGSFFISSYRDKSLFPLFSQLRSALLLFGVLLAYWIFNGILGLHPHSSLYALQMNIHRCFFLFIAAIISARDPKHIVWMLWAFFFMGFYEGLDGIYQYYTGYDLIRHTSLAKFGGRLTGSFSTYRVGNLMSLVIPMGCYALLAAQKPARRLLVCLGLIPPLFLLYGSQTRSGLAGCFVALVVLALFSIKSRYRIRVLLILVLLGGISVFAFQNRFGFDVIMQDGRIQELWPMAWQVFLDNPIVGAGVNCFTPGFQASGIVPVLHPADIPHPHNIYLQFLAETGIVGFLLVMSCFAALTWSGIQFILRPSGKSTSLLLSASCVTATWIGYMVTGISAHNFFRTWWLALAMLLAGTIIGLTSVVQHKTQK